MKLTWHGTASLTVSCGAGRLLIDPFFPLRGSETRVAPAAYEGFRHILVTHGHFDHILDLPRIASRTGAVIHCTGTPMATLLKKGVPRAQLRPFSPGDRLELEGFRVTALQGRHVRYDRALLRRTFLSPRMLRYIGNLPRIAVQNRVCAENGETVAFLIEAEGKRALVLGSLGLDLATDYPVGVDLLALPYQGTSDLLTPALAIIDRLRPRAVMPDHWDDAFPPVSNHIGTGELARALGGRARFMDCAPGGQVEI